MDRSFFDKFNNSTYLKDVNEFGKSIISEIYNILSTRLRLPINIKDFKGTKNNPFNYGILDLLAFDNINKMDKLEQLSDNIKQCIMLHEPRIKDCHIENLTINNQKQNISFNIIFTIYNYSEYFRSNIYINK
ncbi:MAG: GPW/gp25 family protein [Alphaproteobacteria bacterium]|nr:GPW/gp25 family protein [Alphaproteobacteria bacterium]